MRLAMDEPIAPLTRSQRRAAAATAAVAALTRLVPLSKGPWDWDEVLFCLALGDYDVAAHQPHPAGFPFFILLGRAARLVFSSDFHALQAVNVLCAMALFPLAFLFARAIRFDFAGAWSAAVLFAFLPNVWFYGGTAFSDVPALTFYLGAMVAFLRSGSDGRRYLLACVLLAAAVLIRPQTAVLVIWPWAVATFRLLREKRIGAIVLANAAMLLLVAAGYGIAAWLTGVERYVHSLASHSRYVREIDTIAAVHRPPISEVVLEQLDPYNAGRISLVINLLALAALAIGRRRVSANVLLTFAPYFLFTMVAANPLGASRFSLGYMLGIVLLAVEGTRALARYAPRYEPAIRFGVLAVILGKFVTWVLPAFDEPRRREPPPVQAARWVSRNVPKTSTIFVDGSITPWARYYLPDHPRVGVDSARTVVAHPAADRGWYLSIDTTTAAAAVVFHRPRNRTWNIVTQRGFEAFAIPAANVVEFGEGWHGMEVDGATRWRWSSRQAVLRLGPLGGKARLRLQFHVPAEAAGRPIRVAFTLNGKPLDTLVATRAEHDLQWIVEARGDAANILTIEVDRAFVPAHHGSHDTRELGIMLRAYDWRRSA